MIRFTATIKKFGKMGEKTGWTYIDIPEALAVKLNPANRKSFRVKGKMDQTPFEKVSLLPMGGGDFIMTLNGDFRKALKKGKGDAVKVVMEMDERELELSAEMIECMQDEPEALEQFRSMPPSHQHYYSKWINSAKTEPTRARRIAMTIEAMVNGWDFGKMLREARKAK
jgi:hypothetical protein